MKSKISCTQSFQSVAIIHDMYCKAINTKLIYNVLRTSWIYSHNKTTHHPSSLFNKAIRQSDKCVFNKYRRVIDFMNWFSMLKYTTSNDDPRKSSQWMWEQVKRASYDAFCAKYHNGKMTVKVPLLSHKVIIHTAWPDLVCSFGIRSNEYD